MKQKRKRQPNQHHVPYTLIGFGIVIITFIVGFTIGTAITGLPNHLSNQALINEWSAYSTQTASVKATHDPIIQVTQTVAAIETQWTEINVTQTAISSNEAG